jgi:DNA repair exonuclease SbcCD ATPase subunit
MRLQIHKIRWRNFLATGNDFTEIDLESNKTTLFVGKNGSGKSTLLDALSFVLFNKPYRKINKPQLVNTINNKDCLVEIDFKLNGWDFLVRRGMKPTVFEIFKDGELLTQTADNRDYQDAFEKYILKINQKTFCQVVVLGSAAFTPFMALPAMQRRLIIEDLLDLEIFTKMNSLLKQRLDDKNYEIYETKKKKDILDNSVKLTSDHVAKMSQSKESLMTMQQAKLDGVREMLDACMLHIEQVKGEIELMDADLLVLGKLETQYKEFSEIASDLRKREQKNSKEILFYDQSNQCPTCRQIIDDDFKAKIIEERADDNKKVRDGLEKMSAKMLDLHGKISELITLSNKRSQATQALTKDTVNKDHWKKQIAQIEDEIKKTDLQTFEPDFAKLEEIKNELRGVETSINELEDDRTIMGYAAQLLKDSGIKGKIVKSFIPVINQLIQKYLASLDFYVDFHLDEQFNETILSRHRDSFSYESFSEGEKMRLNLAVLFAWRAIAKLRSSINCNVLIFDELLDSSLDTDGTDNILKVIETLTGEDNIVIISHKEQISDRFSKVIRFENLKSFSKVVE